MEDSRPKLVQTEAHSTNTSREKKLQGQSQKQKLFSSQEWLRPNNIGISWLEIFQINLFKHQLHRMLTKLWWRSEDHCSTFFVKFFQECIKTLWS